MPPDARQLIDSIHGVRWRAIELARTAKHARVEVAHLARVLLDDEGVTRAVSACGLDRDDVLALVLGTMDEVPRRGLLARLFAPSESEALVRVYQQALSDAYNGHLAEVSAVMAFAAIVRVEPLDVIGARLDALGLEPLRLMRFAAHGAVDEQPIARGRGPCAIVVSNDPYTPFAFVIEVLEAQLGLSSEEAAAFAVTVHEEGRAELPHEDHGRAVRIAERIRELAREGGYPLAITVR